MRDKVFELMAQAGKREEIEKTLSCNERTERFGITLTGRDAVILVKNQQEILKRQRRIELGESILPQLIETFCDSEYVNGDNFTETVMELQDIFFLYKNESADRLTDEELLYVMKELFEEVCFGSAEYLKETCLERFARAVRAGYQGDVEREAGRLYEQLSEEKRWDAELYLRLINEEIT